MADNDSFYDRRDDMVGGTDNMWNEYNDWCGPRGENQPEQDIKTTFSGPLSQSDLAS
jgi:hypothetical protein